MADHSWTSSGLEILREEDFSGTNLNRPGTYIVCFGAAWCPVTRRFVTRFVRDRGRLEGTLAIADITDTASPLWDIFRIRITPSIVVFRDGRVADRVDGKRFIGLTSAALARLESPRPPS